MTKENFFIVAAGPLLANHLSDGDVSDDYDYLDEDYAKRKDYPSDFRWPESYFDLEASSDVAVVVGQPAFLVCRVAVAGNWTVSSFHSFLFFKSRLLLFHAAT